MDKENIISSIRQFAESQLGDLPDYFLVEVRLSPSNQAAVFIDADKGASIDKLAKINRSLYKMIEEAATFGEGGNFSLEVSSPGLDEPLKLHRQYEKNKGRRIEVLLLDGLKKEGILEEIKTGGIVLKETLGNKKAKQEQLTEIAFNQIKFTKICVVF